MRLTRYPSAVANRPLRQRSSRSARVRLAIRAGAILLIVLVVAVVAAVALVLSGPTEVGFVRDRIASTLQRSLGDNYSVNVARAVIDIDPVLGLVVRVDNIDVRDSTKAVVAHVPSTRLSIDPLSLLRFRVEIHQVELSGAEISFARTIDGAVRLGNAETVQPGGTAGTTSAAAAAAPATPTAVPSASASTGGFPDLFAALRIIDSGVEPPIDAAVKAGFERLALVDSTIFVWDASLQQQRRFPSTDLNIVVDPATSALAINFATSGFSGRWSATIDREIDASTGGHALSVVFSQLTVADVLPGLGNPDSPVFADIPLYGRANVRFDRNGDVAAASARLDLGAGVIKLVKERASVLLDEATLKLRWDIASQALIVDPSTFFFGNTRGVVTGRIAPDGDPAERRYNFRFDSPGAILAPEDSGEPPMVAQRISVTGKADFKQKLLSISNFAIVAPNASIAAAGSLGFEGATPSLALAASFSPMTIGALKQMWIPFIAPDARRWVLEHVSQGRLVSGRFEAAVPAGMMWGPEPVRLPDDAMHLDLRIEDATFTTFGELPAITKASGNIVLAGSTFGVDLDKGEAKLPSGIVTVEAGAFAVPNLAQRPADGHIELQLSGNAAALGEVADSAPLNALQHENMSPKDLSGDATASVSVRLALRDTITEADVDWKVVVNTNNVSSKAPIEGRVLTAANVAITATPDAVTVYGRAKIDGIDADVSMAFPGENGAGEPAGDQRQVRVLLDDTARKRLGVNLDDILSGTMSALITDVTGGQHYDLDLHRARVVLPGLGWSKGIGVPATLGFDLIPTDEGYTVDNLKLSGDGFGFTGSAKLDKSYNLVSADIDNLALHKGDSIAIKLTRGRAGIGINARGTSFDLRGLMAQVRDNNEHAGGFPDLALNASVDELVGFNQETIHSATLNLVSVGGEMQKISFAGKLDDSQISLDYVVTPSGTTLNASTTDAGRLLSFTNLYTRVAGGYATITGQADPNGPMLGAMDLANFDVVNEPAMKELNPNRVESGGSVARIRFDRMVARYRATEGSIAIEDALLRSANIGATFTGRYDLPTAHLSLTGTYLPAYALNNLFGRIPLLGLALGGGAQGGLIGVTFKIEGPITEPHVFINPLSAVAPGIFRKIFEFQQ